MDDVAVFKRALDGDEIRLIIDSLTGGTHREVGNALGGPEMLNALFNLRSAHLLLR